MYCPLNCAMISKLLHGLLDEAKSSMTTTKSSSGGDGRSSCSRSNAVHQQESLFGLLPSSSSSMLLKSPYKATIFPATKSNDNYYNIDKSNNNNNNNTGSMVVLLACSSSSSTQKNQARLLGTNDLPTTMSDNDNSNNNKMGYYGPLGQYRKGFLDHLKPKAVFISVRYNFHYPVSLLWLLIWMDNDGFGDCSLSLSVLCPENGMEWICMVFSSNS